MCHKKQDKKQNSKKIQDKQTGYLNDIINESDKYKDDSNARA